MHVKREEQKRLRIQLSHLRQAGNDIQKTNDLLAKYKDDPKFRQYLELTAGKSDLLQKVENLDKESNRMQKSKEDTSDEDEGIVEDEDKIAKKQEISDASVSGNCELSILILLDPASTF